MSEEQDKPLAAFEVVGDEALEARVVAWVLGEASAFEVEELERLCKDQPALEVFRRRLETVHGLAGESAVKPKTDWKLPEEKRRKVLQVIGVREKQARRDRSSRMAARRVMLAAAACLALTVVVAALVFPMFFGARAGRDAELAGMDQSDHGGIEMQGGAEWKMMRLETDLPSELIEGTPKRVVLPGGNAEVAASVVAGPGEAPVRDMAPDAEPMKSLSRSGSTVTKSRPAARSKSENRQLASRGSATRLSVIPPVVADPDPVSGPAPVMTQPVPKPAPKSPAIVDRKPAAGGGLALNNGGMPGRGGGGPRGGISEDLAIELGRLAGRSAGSAGYGHKASAEVAGGQMELRKLAEKQNKVAADGTVVPSESGGRELRYQSNVRAGAERTATLGGVYHYDQASKDVPATGAMFGSIAGQDGEDRSGRSRGRQAAGEVDGKEMAVKDIDGIVTDGIRSGDGAISRNSIDAILNSPDRPMEPSAPAGVQDFDGNVDYGAPIDRPAAKTSGAREDAARRNLYMGEGNYNLGKFDDAEKHFSKVLEADPDNKAARRWKERVDSARSDYYRAADDHTRAELLSEVDAAWGLETPGEEKGKVREKSKREESEAVDLRRAKVTNERFHEELGTMGQGDTDDDGLAAVDPFATADGDELALLDSRRGLGYGNGVVAGPIGGGRVSQDHWDTERDWSENGKNGGSDHSGPAGGEVAEPAQWWLADKAMKARAQRIDRSDSGRKELEELQLALEDKSVSEALRQEQRAEAKMVAGDEVAIRPERLDDLAALVDASDAAAEPVRPESAVRKLQEQMATDEAFGPEPEIEIVREVIYPTEFEVPELPNAPGDDADETWKREMNGRKGAPVRGLGIDKNGEVVSSSGLASLEEGGLEGELDRLDVRDGHRPALQAEAIDLMAEVAALDEAFSTFSLHVSDASFRVAAAAMERGERPDPEAVRPEEFYNTFDYGDPAPTTGEPVACAIEQCAHPLLPSRNLVRVGVRTAAAGRGAGQPLRLTVMLDNSGSMERVDRREAVEAAMEQLATLLGPQDVVTVVGFARQPRLLADRVSGDEMKKELGDLVGRTPAEGGTNLEQALALADELAMRQFEQGAQNRIVLLTDGAANLGNADPEDLAERIEGLRQRGVSFDAAGFGTAGMNDRMLERLTRDGNGRYYVVDGPEDAGEEFAQKLAGAFRPAAENVKVQVRFNPARVGGYRLIGFEEHRLKKEDFRDDSVDAAEMAAEEAGVAVYQVELLPEGEGEIGEVSVRFRDASKGKMVERSWTMPHDESAPGFDRAPASMQVAGMAVLVADALRDGPLAPLIDWAELAPVTNQVRAEFGGNQKVGQLLKMVERLRE